MMQIQGQDGLRVHVDCGGEVVIVPDRYICTSCGAQSFSDTLSDEEQERETETDTQMSPSARNYLTPSRIKQKKVLIFQWSG
jgi:hypothetical protein